VLLIDTSGLYKYPFIKQLEDWTYDARLNFTRSDTIDERIVIVDIDENSLATVGRWPWGRDKLATIVDNLFNLYEANVVGFDIVFAEKDTSSGLEMFEQLAQNSLKNNAQYQQALDEIRPSLKHDEIFADSLIGKNVVLGYYFKTKLQQGETGVTGLLPPALTRMDIQWSERLPINRRVSPRTPGTVLRGLFVCLAGASRHSGLPRFRRGRTGSRNRGYARGQGILRTRNH
jgi:adenylate cyclase